MCVLLVYDSIDSEYNMQVHCLTDSNGVIVKAKQKH